MSNIYYLCPDSNEPIGGIKVLYRHVDVLNKNNLKAFILHQKKDFKCSWFENETKISYFTDIQFAPDDYLVIPEVYGPKLSSLAPGIKKVVFNQNCYYTFLSYSLDKAATNTP
ncbi:MAG: hypothetical protein PHH14_05435, partial [Candidatus Margulisbacteria bacterium]|nr:hypothetical protein [Candidatus Margulisiibacteriota bacterium]